MNGTCFFNSSVVPAGKRLVIQHVAVEISILGAPTGAPTIIRNGSTNAPGPVLSSFLVPFNGGSALVDQAVQFYVDAGGSFGAFVEAIGGTLIGAEMNFTGYLLDCTVNQCAAIAP